MSYFFICVSMQAAAFMTRWSFSVHFLGAPAIRQLQSQPSWRRLNVCRMSIDAASELSERRTRRNWSSWKKHIPLTMDACFSRHKSGVNITRTRHAELEASITSVSSTNQGPPLVSLLRLCLVMFHNSSVLSGFNCRLFADIQ